MRSTDNFLFAHSIAHNKIDAQMVTKLAASDVSPSDKVYCLPTLNLHISILCNQCGIRKYQAKVLNERKQMSHFQQLKVYFQICCEIYRDACCHAVLYAETVECIRPVLSTQGCPSHPEDLSLTISEVA